MQKNLYGIVLFIIVAFVGGCNPITSKPPTSIPDQERPSPWTQSSEIPQVASALDNVVFTPIDIPYQDKRIFEGNLDFQLLVKTSSHELMTFDLSNEKIERKQLLPTSVVYYPVVSPDGSTMAYIIYQDGHKYLLVKKFSSNSNEIAVPLPNEAVVVRWLSNTKIAVWGGLAEWKCLHFLLVYDDTMAESSYPDYPMPDLLKQECMQLPSLNASGTKMIYPWQMFDFQKGITTDAFPFFNDFPKNPPAYSLKWKNESVSVAYASNDSLNYLLNVPVAEISMGKEPEIIKLPGIATKGGWWQRLVWWQNQEKIGVDLIETNIDPLDLLASGQQVPTRFYVLDFENGKLINYSLDRGVFIERLIIC